MNWQSANLGAAIGKGKHQRKPELFVTLNHIHAALSYQMGLQWAYINSDGTRYDGSMSALYDNTLKIWSKDENPIG
jgi:hypothetical protein